MFTTTAAAIMVLAAASVQAVPQSGSPIYSTQTFYFGGDCTGTADGEATFGAANLCQPLRTVLGTVTSVDVISVEAGCTVHFYTNSACTAGDTVGVVGHCEQASSQFVATNVICP